MNSARTKSTAALALTFAVTAAIGTATSTGASSPREVVTCHGKTATYVGTEGNDKVTNVPDADPDGKIIIRGTDPVIALGGGNDTMRITAERGAFNTFTLCAGDGDDEAIFGYAPHPMLGDHQILLDGGLGGDYIGAVGRPKHPQPLPSLTLIGGSDGDYMVGGTSDDKVIAGRGDDSVSSGPGNDVIFGGTGNDYLRGDEDSDKMIGGQGDDHLAGERDVSGAEDPSKDFGDGGQGEDQCEVEKKKNCES